MVCIGRHAGPRQKPTQSACGLARSTLRHTSRHAQPAEERLASIRCKSGQGVSTSDSQPENGGSNEEAEKPIKHAHERNTSWTRMVLALPLELATVTSRTDNFYLRKRKRKHWWSTEHFPKVCWSFSSMPCISSIICIIVIINVCSSDLLYTIQSSTSKHVCKSSGCTDIGQHVVVMPKNALSHVRFRKLSCITHTAFIHAITICKLSDGR